MWAYVCIYIYVIRMYACMFVPYVGVHVCMHVCMYVCMHIRYAERERERERVRELKARGARSAAGLWTLEELNGLVDLGV